jgi:plastocyanin
MNLRAQIIRNLFVASVLSSISLGQTHLLASDKPLEIDLSDHKFSPQTLIVPAGEPLQIKVANLSKETIEFESFSLNREKVVEPGKSITVHLPALKPGSYDFFDDFHQDVPEGAIVAK